MVTATFVANAFLELPLAIAFLTVGARLHRRSRLERQPGLSWFAAFWVGIGTYGLAESLWALGWLAGVRSFPIALLVLHVKIVASCIAFAGLVVYLLAIHGRDRRVIAVIVGAYGLVLATTATFYAWRRPLAQEPGAWGMRLLYAVNDTEPWWTLLLLLLFLPPFLATLAYLRLLAHARDRTLRYRIKLTGASLLLFFTPLFLGWRAGNMPWWGGIEKVLSVLMAAGIVLALWPPAAWKARLADEAAFREREDALVERARLLL